VSASAPSREACFVFCDARTLATAGRKLVAVYFDCSAMGTPE